MLKMKLQVTLHFFFHSKKASNRKGMFVVKKLQTKQSVVDLKTKMGTLCSKSNNTGVSHCLVVAFNVQWIVNIGTTATTYKQKKNNKGTESIGSNVKLLVIGEENSGKSSLVRWLRGNRSVLFKPIALSVETIDFQNKKFDIWDVSGEERYRQLWPTYYQNTHILLFFFNAKSFVRIYTHLFFWILRNCAKQKQKNKK